MQTKGYIEIIIKGKIGNQNITPENYDIKEIIGVLEQADKLFAISDKNERPLISYSLEEGSVIHKFKTSFQLILGFNAIIGQINLDKNIDFLELPTSKAIESIQNTALKKDYEIILKTSIDSSNELYISRDTKYYRNESLWVEAEFYIYGKVTNAGGKDKANIHIFSDDLGTIRIDTPIPFLAKYDENILYKSFGIRATGKQNKETGEIDKSSLKFKDILHYESKYNENYLNELIKKATKNWKDIKDPDSWLQDLRGGLINA